MFEIILHPAIKRDMKSLPKNIVRRIRQSITDLQTNPYLPNRTEKLSGYRDVYRLKVHQSYRMAYHVDMDARQAAQRLGVSIFCIQRWVRVKKLDGFRFFDGNLQVRRSGVESLYATLPLWYRNGMP